MSWCMGCIPGMFSWFLSESGQRGIGIRSMQGMDLSCIAGGPESCANPVKPKTLVIASAKVVILMLFPSRLSALQNGGIGIIRPLGLLHPANDLVVFFRRQHTNKRHHPLHESAPSCA